MTAPFKVGVAGLIHGHVWGLIDAWKDVPGAELTAVADNTPLLENAASRFQRSYTDWRVMLDTEQLDALVVSSDNVESATIAVEALSKGIPCLVEKAMAANASDADRMLAAAQASNTLLMINWPLQWNPWLHELQKQLDAGTIGHTFHLRFRNGHSGPKEIGCDQWFVEWLYDESRNGGGAIADFGSYGAALARSFFGMPESVYCIRHNTTKDYDVSDDHAVMMLKYDRLDVVLEGTWATKAFDSGPNPVVHGSKGTLAVYAGELRLHAGGEPTVVPTPDLPTRNPAVYFVECLREGKKPTGILDPVIAADAVRITDAAIRSAASGCSEKP